MEKTPCQQYTAGRRFMGRLPGGEDLLEALTALCLANDVTLATFSVNGAVSAATIGAYDQQQRVYVTATENRPHDLIACRGTVSPQDGSAVVQAHAVLGDGGGRLWGGRLFSPTPVFYAEIELLELIGPPLERVYDDPSGLPLWRAET